DRRWIPGRRSVVSESRCEAGVVGELETAATQRAAVRAITRFRFHGAAAQAIRRRASVVGTQSHRGRAQAGACMTRAALLLAGGAGTRLRPLSTEERPKQFLRIFDGQSLIRRTFERVRDLEVFVSTIERYREITLEEIPEIESDREIGRASCGKECEFRWWAGKEKD